MRSERLAPTDGEGYDGLRGQNEFRSPASTMSNPAPDGDLRSEPQENEAGEWLADDVLEVCLERLVARGAVASPSDLRQCLDGISPSQQRFALLELIKLDMALHAESGEVPRLEQYLESFSDVLSASDLPADLVMEEIQLRKDLGESLTAAEYHSRFPQHDALLAHMLPQSSVSATRASNKPIELHPGTEVDDFAIIRILGEGAFAQVYLARQVSMQRLVALKVSGGTGDEPQALAQFDHPNIVRVYDQRELSNPSLHLLYMQFHPGGTLGDVASQLRNRMATLSDSMIDGSILLETIDRSLLSAQQVVPENSAARQWIARAQWPMVVAWIGVQLADALDSAHQIGVLHRDVKPANVLLSAEGIPKLADFNVSIAGEAGQSDPGATLGGSLGYMAPEHLRAISSQRFDGVSVVGKEADLYSLAVLLWELWQGSRPFACKGRPESWSEMLSQQLGSRDEPLRVPNGSGSASERVLEKTLRSALQPEIEARPRDAIELSGRLKLALHPEAASLLDPDVGSFRAWVAKRSPWLVIGLVILLPNIVAGLLNYAYNTTEVKLSDAALDTLLHLAASVNIVVYPLGVVLMLVYARGFVRSLQLAERDEDLADSDYDEVLDLGHRAAVIGGTCWIGAGIVYTAALSWIYPDFTAIQATHFFISMVICGGVAMVYPMFVMTLLATYIYYPALVRGTMRDDCFDRHYATILSRCETYLLIAAIIPLLGAACLVSSEGGSRGFTLAAITAGVIGLLATFYAYRQIAQAWKRYSEVFSSRKDVVPGTASR